MKMGTRSAWIVLLVSCCLLVAWAECAAPGSGGHQRIRHAGCNFRFIRELMRRACAYHSSENWNMGRHLEDNNELGTRSAHTGSHHDVVEPLTGISRHKMDTELVYIQRILKECCPNDKCPPLSKFCR